MKATIIDQRSLELTTKQVVGGGGSRNLITWALLAAKQGYWHLHINAPIADGDARDGLVKSVAHANDILNMHGMKVFLK